MSGVILPVTPAVEPLAATRPTSASFERDPAAGAFGLLLAGLLGSPAQVQTKNAVSADQPAPSADDQDEAEAEAGVEAREATASESGREAGPIRMAGHEAPHGMARAVPAGATDDQGQTTTLAERGSQPVAAAAPATEPRPGPTPIHSAAVPNRSSPAEAETRELLPVTLRGDETGVVRRGRNDASGEPSVRGGPPVATTARSTSRTVDATRIERSLDLLVPEFRVRLERVISRMEAEHGHRVDVVETLRHQVRQNQLFEQGRTQPGPVVTWTRSSNHTRGLAADVMIDGSYDNPAGFARLHRIAVEEGLRTLGARDPGHLELPRPRSAGTRGALAGDHTPAAGSQRVEPNHDSDSRWRDVSPRTARAAAGDGVAQVARVTEPTVSRVPQVAAVATPAVAAIASVATPGKRSTEPVRTVEPASMPAPDLPRVPGSAFAMAETFRAAAPEALASNPLRAGSAERIAHLLDLQSSAPLKPLSQVLLRVDGPGGEDRIRLDLRGLSLGATMDIHDPAAAERLNARIGELQRALEQRGLETESLRVRATPRADSVEISKLAAAIEAEANRAGAVRSSSDSSAPRDRPHDSHRDEPRQNPAHSRQRSRKDSNGGQNT